MSDPDCTSFALLVLHLAGAPADTSVLGNYQSGDHFETYANESSPSTSVNAHVLEILQTLRHPLPVGTVPALARYLQERRSESSLWFDKWHLSPYYSTCAAVIALATLDRAYLRDTIIHLQERQLADGGWGYTSAGSTCEETAYCMQALICFKRAGGAVEKDVLSKGADFLATHVEDPVDSYPQLWVGKGLYCPRHVVRVALLSALHMYENELTTGEDSYGDQFTVEQ